MELFRLNKNQEVKGSNVFSGINTFGSKLLTTASVGAKPAVSTIVVEEYGDGAHHITKLTLTDFVIGALAGAAADLAVGNKIYTFPAGVHLEGASYIDLSLKAAGTAVNTDTGLGSVVATGAVSILSGTGTFEDRHTGQTIATAAAGGTAVKSLKNTTAGVQTGIALNVAASVKDVFLNSAGTWNADNTGNLTATGVIVLVWETIV